MARAGRWRLARAGCLGLALAAAAFTGCGTLPRLDLDETALAESAPVQLDVPFYAQTEYQCGPAALAGILVDSGIDIRPDQLATQIYLPERRGSLQAELVGATRRAGRVPYLVEGTVENLLGEIREGRPVLVLQNLRTRHFSAWHYAVVVGFNIENNAIFLNSGVERGLAMPASKFLRTWDWAGRWALIALEPGELPGNVDRARYLAAVADFEAVAGLEASLPAWEAAAQRWPDEPGPLLALGNSAYGRGDRQTAVRYYRQGLMLQPSDPVLTNNLASVLGELGCPRSAEMLLETAGEDADGPNPWHESIEATRRELAAHPGPDSDSCARWQEVN